MNFMLAKFLATYAISIVLVCAISGFTAREEIDDCFITFKRTGSLIATSLDRLPEQYRKPRGVTTEKGEEHVSVADGYRVLYSDCKGSTFVNLKVELSHPESYDSDREVLLDHLAHMSSHDAGPGSFVKMGTGRYEIFGFSRNDLESGNIQGVYAMFPKKNVVVYFYFNNLGPGNSLYKDMEEYRRQRDIFFVDYVTHLQECLGE